MFKETCNKDIVEVGLLRSSLIVLRHIYVYTAETSNMANFAFEIGIPQLQELNGLTLQSNM